MAKKPQRRVPKTPKEPTALPKQLAPMLAETANEAFDSPDHLFEIKWDGIRCIAFVESGKLQLQGRRLNELSERYPELHGLSSLSSGTILDGEIIALHEGRPSFEKLQQRMHATQPNRIAMISKRVPVTFVAFDLLYLSGQSLLASPLIDRRKELIALMQGKGIANVVDADFVVEQGMKYFQAVQKAGLEGMMAKRLDSVYMPGKRTGHWLKIKAAQSRVFDILGFTKRKGEDFISALLLGLTEEKAWIYKGNVGTGFNEAQRGEFFRALEPMPPLKNPPKDGPKDAIWKKTGLRCKVRFFEETSAGRLRGPVFEGFEVDS